MQDRDERGQFKQSSDQQMTALMIERRANRPGMRLMRRLFDADARARQEAQNGD